jgi:hypothetical protein
MRCSTYYEIGQGSTVIGNTAVSSGGTITGISVACPSVVTDNTANNFALGEGCSDTNNVAVPRS